MSDEESTSRASVKTYVPTYQKEEWQAHADALEMSQSEFVRTMVQAGRRQYSSEEETETQSRSEPNTTGGSESDALSEQIVAVLDSRGALSWEDLYEELTDDVETRLDECLEELQSSNTIKYSGREGGYTLTEP